MDDSHGSHGALRAQRRSVSDRPPTPRPAPDGLLPLDGAGRLRCDVEDHPVDLRHLVGDARRDASSTSYGSLAQSAVIASSLVTGRSTTGWPYDRPSPWTPTERTSASSTTGHCQIARSSPPAISSSRAIASASRSSSSRSSRHFADDADAESRTGERLPLHDVCGQAELFADSPHLVLEQPAQRLDQLEGAGRPAGHRRCDAT